MNKKRSLDAEGKVVPFPNLKERLLSKAANALKAGNHRQALELFEQLERTDPDNAQAAYGMAVCYVELGYYDKAEALTKNMMEKGIGDYFDVLKLHITILIQRKNYEEVLAMVEAVLDEESVPDELIQTLEQLAQFAKTRMSEWRIMEKRQTENAEPSRELTASLASPDQERQWQAFYQAQQLSTPTILPLFRSYLKDKMGDILLKSMMIKDLKERGVTEQLTVEKLGEEYTVDLSAPLFYEPFPEQVQVILREHLESNNPTLYELAIELWGHFIIGAFPIPLEPASPQVWAAACYDMIHKLSGDGEKHDTLLSAFSIHPDEMKAPVRLMEKVENWSAGRA